MILELQAKCLGEKGQVQVETYSHLACMTSQARSDLIPCTAVSSSVVTCPNILLRQCDDYLCMVAIINY